MFYANSSKIIIPLGGPGRPPPQEIGLILDVYKSYYYLNVTGIMLGHIFRLCHQDDSWNEMWLSCAKLRLGAKFFFIFEVGCVIFIYEFVLILYRILLFSWSSFLRVFKFYIQPFLPSTIEQKTFRYGKKTHIASHSKAGRLANSNTSIMREEPALNTPSQSNYH